MSSIQDVYDRNHRSCQLSDSVLSFYFFTLLYYYYFNKTPSCNNGELLHHFSFLGILSREAGGNCRIWDLLNGNRAHVVELGPSSGHASQGPCTPCHSVRPPQGPCTPCHSLCPLRRHTLQAWKQCPSLLYTLYLPRPAPS